MLVALWHAYKRALQGVYFLFRHPGVRVVKTGGSPGGQKNFRSQFGQDAIVADLFRGACGGRFLDIGANHPEYLSNTYYFETELGWKGVAVEPLPEKGPMWRQSRPNTHFVNAFAGQEVGCVEFISVSASSGWEDMMSSALATATAEQVSRPHARISVPGMTVDSILEQAGIDLVDFVSIDVEGAEMDVLQSFDLGRFRPKVVVVENTKRIVGDEDIRRYLHSKGYSFRCRIWTTDDLYLRNL